MAEGNFRAMPQRKGWREELVELWDRLPNKAVFGALAAGWLGLFHWLGNSTFGYVDTPSLLGWMLAAYQSSEDDAIGLLMPAVVLILLWGKRKALMECPKTVWAGGLVLLAASLLLHVFGYAAQQPRISILGFLAGLYGLMGLAWGKAWLRTVWFPYFLLVFCIPFSVLTEGVSFRLRLLATALTAGMARHLLGIEVTQEGTALLDPSGQFQYEVAAACSGLRSLISLGAVAVILAFLQLRNPWRRLVIILSAVPLAVAGNVFRLLTIVLAAKLFGQQAGDWVHQSIWFSLLPYVPAFGGLCLVWYMVREKQPEVSDPAALSAGCSKEAAGT